MVDSYTTSNRLGKWAFNSHVDAWDVLEGTKSDMVDEAMDGQQAIVTAGGTTVLTTNNNASDQARPRRLKVSGTGGTITLPAVKKWYIVSNTASGTVTFGCGGATVILPAYAGAIVGCDGTDCTIHGYLNKGFIKLQRSTIVAGTLTNYLRDGTNTSTGTVTSVTFDITNFVPMFSQFRFVLTSVGHAAGANRALRFSLLDGGSGGIGSLIDCVSGTNYSGVLHVMMGYDSTTINAVSTDTMTLTGALGQTGNIYSTGTALSLASTSAMDAFKFEWSTSSNFSNNLVIEMSGKP